MRRVRCPGCSNIIQAAGDIVKCGHCGLKGRVDAPAAATPKKARDPWQITIDLRKLSPTHWPGGVRAFGIVLLIGFAFVAGGFTGVAFERGKAEVLGDLDGGIFGGGSGTSANASGTTPSSPAKEPVVGDPVPPPQESASTIRHDLSDQDAAPKVTLRGGLVRLMVSYDDAGTHAQFRIKFMQDGQVQASLSASTTGPYDGVRYMAIPAGTYDVSVGLAGDDATWTLRIEEPAGEVGKHRAGTFSEHGDDGIGPLKVSGTVEVSFTASKGAAGTVSVKAYRADGSKISGCGTSFGDTSPENRYAKTWGCNVGSETLVYFDIGHPTDKDGTWTLQVA